MMPLLKDWALTRAASEELEAYLLSAELYWHLSPKPGDRRAGQLLILTPGNLMLSLRRLFAHPWKAGPQKELDKLYQLVEGKRHQWRTAWLKKANREMQARLKLWQEYLVESAENGGNLVDYSFQVRLRMIFTLLQADGVEISPLLRNQLAALDDRLRSLTEPAPFIWEPELQTGFGADEFWYLFRAPGKG